MRNVYEVIEEEIEALKGNWKELFNSDMMRDYLQKYAENLFCGVFDSLRLQGAQISENLLETESRKISVERIYDPNSEIQTGCCSSTRNQFVIRINGCGNLLNEYQTVEEKFSCVSGLLVHECGHRLFTDFKTLKAHLLQMEKYGAFFPKKPDNANTPDGILFQQMLTSDEYFRSVVADLLRQLENAIEDARIENELKSHYRGLASYYLSFPDALRRKNAPSMTAMMEKNEPSLFSIILSQWFQYALYGELNPGEREIDEFDPEMVNTIYQGMDSIDAYVDERDPMECSNYLNELLVLVSPFLMEEYEKESQQNGQSGQQNGGGGMSGGAGGAGGQGSGNAAQKKVAAEALKKLIDQVASDAASGKASSHDLDNSNSTAITNPATGTNSGLQKTISGRKNKAGNNSGKHAGGTGGENGNAGGQQSGQGGSDRSFETPDITQGENDLNDMLTSHVSELLHERMEEERLKEMQREVRDIFKEGGKNPPEIIRDLKASPKFKQDYEKAKGRAMVIAQKLADNLRDELTIEEMGDTKKWQYYGKKFSAMQYCRNELKGFTKNTLTRERFSCSVYVLLDESGSVSGDLLDAEIKTSMCLEQFCTDMDIPLTIQGFTRNGCNDCTIYSYVEEESIDGNDKYRLMGVKARGGTPTVTAMTYAIGRMSKRNRDVDEKKLLFIITDGRAGDDDNNGTLTKELIKKAREKKIITLGCGIGSDRDSVENQFGGGNYLGISNLDDLPIKLLAIIKRYFINE